MRIPLANPKAWYEFHRGPVDKAISRALDSGRYVGDCPEVRAWEEEVAEYCGNKYAIGVASGTAAMELGLRAFVINDVPLPHICPAAVPCAVAKADCNPKPNDELWGPLHVHLYGEDIANTQYAVADCSQAPGSWMKDDPEMEMVRVISHYPTKPLGSFGDAGTLLTNHATLASSLRSMREYFWNGNRNVQKMGYVNSRMDAVQVAILRVRLRYLNDENAERLDLAKCYIRNLPSDGITIIRSERLVWHLFVIRFDSKEMRDQVKAALTAAGIGTGWHYPSLGWHKAFAEHFDAVAHAESERLLTLPLWNGMAKMHVREICQHVERAMKGVEQCDG